MEAGHALMDALSDGERQQATIGQDLPGEQAARHRRAEGRVLIGPERSRAR